MKKNINKNKYYQRNRIANFYNRLLKKHGDNPNKALGRYDLSKSKKKFDFVINHINDVYKGKKLNVLDIGCGIGQFLKSRNLDIKKINYTGIDVANESINYCRSKFKKESNFLTKDIFEKNAQSNYFLKLKSKCNIVFSVGTIEQKNFLSSENNLIYFIKNSLKFTKKNGYIIFDYFYRENLDFTNSDCNYLPLKKIINISKRFSSNIKLNFNVSKFEVLVSLKV